MAQTHPLPVFLSETLGADRGLICGYQLSLSGAPREILADGIVEALDQPDAVTWLHFNLSDARARRWLLEDLCTARVKRRKIPAEICTCCRF